MAGAHPLGSDGAELVRERSKPAAQAGSDSPPSPSVAPLPVREAGAPQPHAGSGAAPGRQDRIGIGPAPSWQPRLLVALALIVAGIVWAAARGLQAYGLSVMEIIYDLDQPPVLLILAGAWLAYRSRRT